MNDRQSGAAQVGFTAEDGIRLAGALTLPPGAGPFPAVVAVHAAGSGVRDAPLHRHLTAFLSRLGIGVFIYDRRGEGASEGRPGAPLGVLAGDVQAALSLVAAHPAVDADRIGLWGHSQGAWIAPIAAARCNVPAFLIVVAGPGVSPHQQMIFATANLLREAGYSQNQIVRATRLRERMRELRQDRGPVDEARALLQAASREPWFALTYLPDPVGLDYWISPGRPGGLGSSLSDLLGPLPTRPISAWLPDGAGPA